MIVVRMLVGFIIALAALFLVLCIFLYLRQGKMVFVPDRRLIMTPNEAYLVYEDVYIQVTTGEKIHGWYFPVAGTGKTVLFCHGNAGNVSHRLETVQTLVRLGVNVFLFDYRGYGLSDGSPTEENVYADAEAAYRWLRAEKGVEARRIILFGRSLGGAVAVELADRAACAGLILESSFTSAAELGRWIFPYLPTSILIRYRFDSISKIGQLDCPILVVHSPDDAVIPFEMGQRLYEAAAGPKRFVCIQGGHNDREYLHNELYISSLYGFISSS